MWPFNKSKPKPVPAAKPAIPRMSAEPRPMTLNPTTEQRYRRTIKRSRRLLLAIEKAEGVNDSQRIVALTRELNANQHACLALELDHPMDLAGLDRVVKDNNWSDS